MKRCLCGILAILLLLSVFPLTAAAAENPDFPNNPPAHVDTVEEKVDWIAQKCRETGLTDEWEIALWLHDWLIYNANYDYTYTYYYPDGVLLKGTGVCDSYTQAYNLLLNEFNIECKRLSSEEMNHAWNLVKIDGEWCHIDCTWDDPGEGGHECHTYFGMTDKMIGENHYGWDTSEYPACTSKINYYPIRMGYHVYSTKEEMIAILNQEAAAKTKEFNLYYIGDEPDFPADEYYSQWFTANKRRYGINGRGHSLGGSEHVLWVYLTYWKIDEDHEHNRTPEVVSPTCTQKGYTEYICYCGDIYIDSYVDALGHSFEDYVFNGDATCSTNGTETAKCVRCDVTDTTIAAGTATGHTFEDGFCIVCGSPEYIPGDIDGNEEVNVDDVLALLWNVLFPEEYPIEAEADFDGSDMVDVDDVLALLWHVLFPDEYPL